MLFFNRNARALEHAQMQWLGLAYKAPNNKLTQQVRDSLGEKNGKADGDILVTKVGFSSIAIHADHAAAFQSCMVAPGVDHNGRQGFLVIGLHTVPFYSLADSASEAVKEAIRTPLTQKLHFSHA